MGNGFPFWECIDYRDTVLGRWWACTGMSFGSETAHLDHPSEELGQKSGLFSVFALDFLALRGNHSPEGGSVAKAGT